MGEKQIGMAERDLQQVAASALQEAQRIRFPKDPTSEQIRGVFLDNQITEVIGHSLAEHNPNGTMVLPGEEWLIGIFDTGNVVDGRVPPYQLVFRHQGGADRQSRGGLIAYLNQDFSLNAYFGIRSHTPPTEQVKILKECLGFAARVIKNGEVVPTPKLRYKGEMDHFSASAEAA